MKKYIKFTYFTLNSLKNYQSLYYNFTYISTNLAIDSALGILES
jgi:hypothetical protein